MTNTDSITKLARRHAMTRADVRETARDLGLTVNYDSTRRTWFVNESATAVTMFNSHLAAR